MRRPLQDDVFALYTTELLLEADMPRASFQARIQNVARLAVKLLRREQHRRLALVHDIEQLMGGESGGEG
jgi:hypothetical protein